VPTVLILNESKKKALLKLN